MPVQTSMYLENAATLYLSMKRPKSPLELKKWIAKLMTEWPVECISPLEKKKIAARRAMLAEKAGEVRSKDEGATNEETNDENNDMKVNGNEVKASGVIDDNGIGQDVQECKRKEEVHEDMEVLGPYSKFPISSRTLGDIDWSSASHATRSLLTAVFPREVLATHSLSGRPSPAFPKKPAKRQLDPRIIKDIINLVKEKSGVKEEKNVRALITTKCADEGKMLRIRERNERRRHQLRRKINVPSRYSPEL